jgi:hypothetical protein
MSEKMQNDESNETAASVPVSADGPERRRVLKRLGRFAAVTGPAITLLLAVTTKPKQAKAASVTPL